MSAVDDLQSYLEAEGLIDGSTSWPSFRRIVVPEPDEIVVITEDGGGPPEIPSVQGIGDMASQDPSVQIRVRGTPNDTETARAQINLILRAVHGLTGAVLGSTTYIRVAAETSEPIYIGLDEHARPEFTITFRMMSLVPI